MEKVRIQDDLFSYVNQEWIDQAVIPDDRPSCGGFADLDKGVEKLLINEFNNMKETNQYPNDYLKYATLVYKKVLDVKKRQKDGIKPVLKELKRIEALKDVSSLNRHLVDLVSDGFPLPFNISVEENMKDATKYLVYIEGPSTILPDATYYREEMAAQKAAIIGLWSNMTKAILAQTKLSEEDQAKYLQDTLAFDELVAKYVKTREEKSEYTKLYNIWTTRKASTALKPIKFRKLLEGLFGQAPEVISVAEPRYVKEFKNIFNEETFELYIHWAYVLTLIGSCSILSEELRDLGSTYQRALTGVKAMPAVDKYAMRLASGIYSEAVGVYYGQKYFGEEAKKDVVDLVYSIIETYKKRIKENNFLQDATKEKAILKLSNMKVKMGYPDEVDSFYNELTFDDNASLFEVVNVLSKKRRLHNFAKLNKPVDRKLWAMPGHMVNACYNPFANDITFPAAILQAPFYSIKQTRSQNLGGIGAVIGHEISHAFDNNGAKFDENGNLFDWWTKEDIKQFNVKTKAMVKQFEGITLPWGPVNANLIVSENIADNGGVAVTLDIMSRTPNASYDEYFQNWAKVWCIKAKPEYQQLLLRIDVHGPAILRANMPPRNFNEWYDTYNVTKKDQMYIDPKKRVVIW